jgi:hypothetical protein
VQGEAPGQGWKKDHEALLEVPRSRTGGAHPRDDDIGHLRGHYLALVLSAKCASLFGAALVDSAAWPALPDADDIADWIPEGGNPQISFGIWPTHHCAPLR